MKEVILVKLGGSIITDKDTPYKARVDIVKKLAKALKKVTHASLVLAHGQGSFAHTSAKEFGGKKGYKSKWGIAKVARDAMEINRIVMNILIEEGVPAVSLRPMSMIQASSGKIKKHLFEIVEEVINQDLIPVIYGDVLFDKKWKTTIYSGETILNEIGMFLIKKGFKVGKIIQVGETNGIYDDKGKTILSITNDNWKDIRKYIFKNSRADVTGGMEHKIENALLIAGKGIQTWITSGIVPDEFYSALHGKIIRGTIIQ